MDPQHRRPQHTSYRLHRKQVAWQIILPIALAGLILLGGVYLIVVGTFRANGDVGRWAAISTMWLTIPVILGGLIQLAVLVAVAWLIGKAAGLIPPYTHKAQVFANEMQARVKQGAQYAYRPFRILPQIGQLIRNRIRRLRGR